MDKNSILNQVDNLSAEQLHNFIFLGIVTLQELRETQNLDSTKRNAILALQNAIDAKDENACAEGNE